MDKVQLLKSKCAVVTGSTSGIGWGIVQRFAKAGCNVMFHGLEKESEIAKLKAELESLSKGSKVSYSSADLTQESACKDLISKATSDLGKVDIVVNNAGIQFTAPTHEYPTDKWNLVMALNCTAPFFISRAVLPQMYDRKWGRLIHIGSAHSMVASVNKSAYCAAKHGILGLSRVIALESAGTGVTSNTICPGWVLTPLVQKQVDRISKEKGISIDEAKRLLVCEKMPSGQFVEPEQLGSLAVYLSTDDAAQCTGGTFSMDGAWTTH